MERRKLLLVLTASLCLAAPAFAQFPGPASSNSGGNDSDQTQQPETRPEKDKDSDTTSSNTPAEQPEMPPSELDFPLDEHIKVKLEPYIAGAVVDRIIEKSQIVVESPNSLDIEVFVVPVDAPYGGKALEKPHSIGRDANPADGFKVTWGGKEKSLYVKVFAVATKRTGGLQRRYRSHTLDFGMGGARFDGVASQKQAVPTTADSKKP